MLSVVRKKETDCCKFWHLFPLTHTWFLEGILIFFPEEGFCLNSSLTRKFLKVSTSIYWPFKPVNTEQELIFIPIEVSYLVKRGKHIPPFFFYFPKNMLLLFSLHMTFYCVPVVTFVFTLPKKFLQATTLS